MKTRKNKNSVLQSKLLAYSEMGQGNINLSQKAKTIGITAATLFAGGAALDAAVVTVTSGLSFDSGDGGFFIDMDGNSVNDFHLLDGLGFNASTMLFQSANLVVPGNAIAFVTGVGVTTYAKRFSSGESILAGSAFGGGLKYLNYLGGGYPNSQFNDGERGFAGVRFDIGGSDHLGYIELEGTATGMIIHGWAYNDIAIGQAGGDSIITQAVPEASQVGGIALLCMGAIGIAEMRRRREKTPIE